MSTTHKNRNGKQQDVKTVPRKARKQPKPRPGQQPNAFTCPKCKGEYRGGTLYHKTSTTKKKGHLYSTLTWVVQHHYYENGESKTKECYLGVHAEEKYPKEKYPELAKLFKKILQEETKKLNRATGEHKSPD